MTAATLDPITPAAFRACFTVLALERLGIADPSDAQATADQIARAADDYAANPYWLDTGPEAASEHYLFSDGGRNG